MLERVLYKLFHDYFPSTGACVCKPGMVAWKWECHPLVGLGEPCITSAQCKSQVSNLVYTDFCFLVYILNKTIKSGKLNFQLN